MLQHDVDKQFYEELLQQSDADMKHFVDTVGLQIDLRQGVDDDCESLAAELRFMEEFFFQGLPFPQGRRFFCPVTDGATHMVLAFGCADSLRSHLWSVHHMTLSDFEQRFGWSPLLLTQNLPLQSAQTHSELNYFSTRRSKNSSVSSNAPDKDKVAVGVVVERKNHSLETLLTHLNREKSMIQDRISTSIRAKQAHESRKLQNDATRRLAIGELLSKLDSAIIRLKNETGSKLTQAILDIGNLAYHSPHIRSEIVISNVLPVICALLQSRSEAHREHAASAIKNLCLDLEHQRKVRKAGCIAPLVALLRGTRMQRKESLCALVNLVRGAPGSLGNIRNQRALVDAGGLDEIRQINETANDSVRQLTESVLAWMETFDPTAAQDHSSSESDDGEFKPLADIEKDRLLLVSLERYIADSQVALARITEFRAALPSIQITCGGPSQAKMQRPAISFQPQMPSSYPHLVSSNRPSVSQEQPRRLGARSAAVTHKYFTLIGNMDYTCNTCGATVRDGTRDYHLKRYHPEMIQRLHEEGSAISANAAHDGEKKVSVLSVTYDNLGDLNFKCRLCGKIVRDGSRDYHIKQRHGDRIEELKEQKRQLMAERAASDAARRLSSVSSPSMTDHQPPDSFLRNSSLPLSSSACNNTVTNFTRNEFHSKSHKQKERSSELREPRDPKDTAEWQMEEMKKKGVSLRENEKLRNFIIESVASFMEMDACCAFRNDAGVFAECCIYFNSRFDP
jgi:hypothetical protein